MHPDTALHGWQAVMLLTGGDGIGFASSTSIARASKGHISHAGRAGSRLPAHVDVPGIGGFQAVERALSGLTKAHRRILMVEMVHPCSVVGKTQRQRAAFLDLTFYRYRLFLDQIREALSDEAIRKRR